MVRRLTERAIKAAGGVLWRATGDGIEVALVHRPRYDDWSIPKGKLGPGETDIDAAAREVWEETGFEVGRIGRYLGEVRYLKPSGEVDLPKVVRYWSMRAGPGEFGAGDEVDQVRWVEPGAAEELLTTATDRRVMRRFLSAPAETGMVVLVRHASAGSRSKWRGDDRARLLDKAGHTQAEALMKLLRRFAVTEIVSADYTRCVQTVEPLSEVLAIPIGEEPLFSEDGYPGNESKAMSMIRTLSDLEGAAVVCTQGNVVPEIVQMLADEDGLPPIEPFEAKKGSAWALSFDSERLVGADYFAPPPSGC